MWSLMIFVSKINLCYSRFLPNMLVKFIQIPSLFYFSKYGSQSIIFLQEALVCVDLAQWARGLFLKPFPNVFLFKCMPTFSDHNRIFHSLLTDGAQKAFRDLFFLGFFFGYFLFFLKLLLFLFFLSVFSFFLHFFLFRFLFFLKFPHFDQLFFFLLLFDFLLVYSTFLLLYSLSLQLFLLL